MAEALGRWLVELSAQESATSPQAAPAEPSAPQPASAAPIPIPTRINGPRIVEVREPGIDLAVAARALADGIGQGGISPRIAPAQVGPAPQQGSAIDVDLGVISRRCRVKAEACAFARERNRSGFDTVRDRYDRLRAEANTLQPCYLWAIQRDTEWLDDGLLEQAEGCYTNLASAAELASMARSDAPALELLAEAQGALFLLLQGIEQARGDDRDQRTVFAWLRGRAERMEINPRILDAARGVDPSAWRGLESRLARSRESLDAERRGERARRQALNTVQYHAGRIADAHETEERPDLAHDWNKVQEAVSDFLAGAGQHSDPALVEALAPIAEHVPEAMLDDGPIAPIMPYIDERLSLDEPGDAETPSAPARRVTEELLRARDLLRGRVVVLLGGKCRHKSKRLIERELELKELRWISSDPHESIAPFEAEIARPDVGAVLMMIRWSSHSFEGVKEFCARHDKPYVRVPAGYNPSQLAHQIIQQQGERLAREAVA